MLRKTRLAALAALAALTLSLTACGGGPDTYTLRSDLCEVLDYQAFSRWFGTMESWGRTVGNAKITCVQHGNGFSGTNLTTRVEAYKYESPEEAKKIFDRLAKDKSDMDGKLKASVDDVRYYQGYAVAILDADLFLTVGVDPQAADDSSFRDELPRLTVEFADQILERLREKS